MSDALVLTDVLNDVMEAVLPATFTVLLAIEEFNKTSPALRERLSE